MYRVEIDDSGRVALPHRVVTDLKGSILQVKSWSPGHVFLGVEGAGAPDMAITLGAVAIPDVLSFFNMFRKTGTLFLDLEDGFRRLFFKDGEIIFATSDRPEDNLEEVLCAMGKLDRAEIKRVRAELSADANLSQVLVKRELVAARDLWLATRQQVESIVYAMFSSEEGSCYFIPGDPEKDNIVRLSMSTQNLIMEGLRRVDEKALYWRKLGSMDALLSYSGRALNGLTPEENKMMANLYSGEKAVRTLLAGSDMAEFDTLRLLYQLADKKMLEINEPEVQVNPLDPELESIFAVFNEMLTLMYEEVSPHCTDMLEEVNRYIRELPHPHVYVFRGMRVNSDGALDANTLADNLLGLELSEQMRLLIEALTEVVYMECSLARKELGADGSTDLVRRVQDFTQRARKLIE